jgi:hypothetical protein
VERKTAAKPRPGGQRGFAAVRLWLVVALAAVAVASPPGSSAGVASAEAPGTCSTAVANRLVERHRLNDFLLPKPIGQLLCGPFTGPGSEAMVVAIQAPTCWGLQRWAVFGLRGGAWQLVHDRHVFIHSLVAVGPDIRETTPVFRPGDSRCNPSGGRQSRTWHWNGTRFVISAGTEVKPRVTAPAAGFFKTPSGNIVCHHSPGPADMPLESIACGITSGLKPAPPRRPCREGGYAGDRVYLNVTGRTQVPACAGDPGPLVGLQLGARTLGYGKTWSGGGLRCSSAVTGLTCRNASGHGFFLSRASWRRF